MKVNRFFAASMSLSLLLAACQTPQTVGSKPGVVTPQAQTPILLKAPSDPFDTQNVIEGIDNPIYQHYLAKQKGPVSPFFQQVLGGFQVQDHGWGWPVEGCLTGGSAFEGSAFYQQVGCFNRPVATGLMV